LFSNSPSNLIRENTPFFSKMLSTSQKNTSFFQKPPHIESNSAQSLSSKIDFGNSTFVLKQKTNLTNLSTLTYNESLYMCVLEPLNNKVHNIQISPKILNSFTKKTLKYPLKFNFNLKTNLNISNQQR
jgi:hypothetical protein